MISDMKKADIKSIAVNNSSSKDRRVSESRSFTQGDSKSGKAMSDYEYADLIVSRIEQSQVDVTKDEVDWTNILLGFATTFGEQGRDFAHRVSRFWVKNGKSYDREEVDRKYDWCLANGRSKLTVATFIKIVQDYGVDTTMPPGCYPEGMEMSKPVGQGKKTKDEQPLVIQVRDFLNQMAEFRYNVVREVVEVRNLNQPTDWEMMTDRIFDTLFTKLHTAGIKVKKGDLDSYLKSDGFSPAYDPILSYFESLPKWDPSQPDYISEFFGYIKIDESDEYAELSRRLMRKWFLNTIALMTHVSQDNQLVMVLLGNQNVGKTHFCKHILPPGLREYFHTIQPNTPLDKDQMLALSYYSIILLDEFKIDIKSSNAWKAMTSTAKTEIRSAYSHNPKIRIRIASFVATGNDVNYLYEEQGSRRFFNVSVKSTETIHSDTLPYAGAYAQAYYLVSQPEFRSNLTSEEVEELMEMNRKHIEDDPIIAAIECFFRKPKEGEVPVKVNVADIIEMISFKLKNIRYNSSDIGKAMKKMQFDHKNHSGKSVYFVVRKSNAEYEDECKQSGKDFYDHNKAS